MKQYHIIWQRVDSEIEQDTLTDWGWIADKLAYPPRDGESYTIFTCTNPTCRDARNHPRLWENVFSARISASAERSARESRKAEKQKETI